MGRVNIIPVVTRVVLWFALWPPPKDMVKL